MTTSTTNVLHLTHTTKPYAQVKPGSDRHSVLSIEGRPEQSIPMSAEAVADTLVRLDGYVLMT